MDKFTKGCLAIIAISLSVLAGTSVYHTSVGGFAAGNAQQSVRSDWKAIEAAEDMDQCLKEKAELTASLSTLEEQIQKLSGDGDATKQTYNRLHEQLMFDVVDKRARIAAMEVRCSS